MKVAIVILNYNGLELLKKFLPNVIEHSIEANIYVIDNASTDGSQDYINSLQKEVVIIQNKQNYGYAKGYNKGLQYVKEEIFCLLNSDVEVTTDWLRPIMKVFSEKPNTAIIQPKILDHNKRDFFEYAGASGGYIDKYGFPFCRGRLFDTIEVDNGQYDNAQTIFWASGACFFVKNEVFNLLGRFDETFFAHMEEIDLCWRAFNHGYESMVIPESMVYHVGGGTLSYGDPKKTFLNFRNSLYTLIKNVPKNLFSTLFIRLSMDGLAIGSYIIKLKPLHALAIAKAHCYFYFNFTRFYKLRKNVKKNDAYYKIKSVVWSYFIRKKKEFQCL